jgi:glycerate-2-kinase
VLAPPELAPRLASDGHPGVRVFPADHPIPTERNTAAARALAESALLAPEDECVLVLISGGGSAHLTLPRSGITLDDIRSVTGNLLRAGAPIGDLNTVRRAMEQLKAGGLRSICPARRVIGLVVSDVVGDDPAMIASGPLMRPDPEDRDPAGVLQAWGVRVPPAVLDAMRAPRPTDRRMQAEHHIVLNGPKLMEAMPNVLDAVGRFGHRPLHAARTIQPLQGEASDAGRRLAAALLEVDPSGPGRALAAVIGWGETTVSVGDATGTGGRNLETALAAAIALPDDRPWALITLATDGIDGPTDAAGAVLCSEMFADPRARTLAANALKQHDSYHGVEMLGGLIRTGPSGTNVNDIAVLWWREHP